ncbi:MAG: hypothetical protein IJ572_00295 [Bacilli bacterium]|nr:hypothetical protein [Bacilli bacterium]
MKEESKAKKTSVKKETAKKASTTKTSAAKRVVTKTATAAKKTTTKKVTTKPTTKTVAKSSAKKTASVKAPAKKTTSKKVVKKKETIAEPKEVTTSRIIESSVAKEIAPEVKVEESNTNKDLVLRSIIIMTYTIIIVLLVIGFIDSLINAKPNKVDTDSYIVSKQVLKESNIIDIRDARTKFSNFNGNYFIYLSYSNNSLINTFEKELENVIDKYGLKDKFYYVSLDAIKDYDNRLELTNKYLGYTDVLVTKLPTIIYVNNDNIVRRENIITREDNNLITIGDFQNLLDINNFKTKK